MLIGAHVSPAGGPANAVGRAEEKGATAMQIFNQSPRMWRPYSYSDEQVAEYHARLRDSPVEALLIHAVYLLNCASDDSDIREKTLASLVVSLEVGAALGARGVVLHPGSAKTGDVGAAIARAGELIAEAMKRTDGCDLHLENTAGAGGTLGRSFEELARLLEACGEDSRIGTCLDSCHLYASGYDIRTFDGLTETLDEYDKVVGIGTLGSLHLNDSQMGLGSNRDRHANVTEGELGEEGCMAFLSEPRFEDLPVVLETPGENRSGPTAEEIALCFELRERGLKRRKA